MKSEERLSAHERFFVAGMALVALAVRLSPALVGGNILPSQADAYYHLRRAELFLRNFPDLPGIDPFMSFPVGAECPWPPLYDLLAAGLAGAWSGVFGGAPPVLIVSALLPPLCAAAAIVPIYRIARRFGGAGAAFAAVLSATFLATSFNVTAIGEADHHAAEILLMMLFLDLSTKALSATDGSPFRRALAPGLSLAAGVLVWQGFIVYAAAFCAAALLHGAVSRLAARRAGAGADAAGEAPGTTAAALGIATVLCSGVRLLLPSETEQTVFDFGYFSWFQPLFLATLAGIVAVFPASPPRGDAGARRIRTGRLAAVALAAAVLLLLLLSPAVRRNLAAGIAFVATDSPFLDTIGELRPTLSYPVEEATPWLRYAARARLALLLFLPALLVGAGFVARARKRLPSPSEFLLAAWTLLLFVLAARQIRWLRDYAWLAPVVAGLAAARLFPTGSPVRAFLRDRLGPVSFRGAASALLVGWCAAALHYGVAARADLTYPRGPGADYREAFRWLKEGTLPVGDPYDLTRKPPYAVLAFWDIGHWIQWFGERPTVANNFGDQPRGRGLEDSLAALLAPEERTLEEICRRRGARYLFLTHFFPKLAGYSMARLAGVDFDRLYAERPPGAPAEDLRPNRAFLSLPSNRLYLFDGAATPEAPAMAAFRLVFESPSPVPAFAGTAPGSRFVKIFECVAGAVVEGTTSPGAHVRLSVPLAGTYGRPFVYESRGQAGPDGRFAIRFPYATRDFNGSVMPMGRGRAQIDGRTLAFDVSERDVLSGGRVTVEPGAGGR